MILGSWKTWPVGERVVIRELTDTDGVDHHQIPAFILREVTEREWRQGLPEANRMAPANNLGDRPAWFYAVSID